MSLEHVHVRIVSGRPLVVQLLWSVALGLGLALAAIGAANRTAQAQHRTFGLYRLEILAALANAVLLFGVAGYVLVEALGRLDDPPEIDSLPVFVVGLIGLAANLVAFLLLRRGAEEHRE